MFSCRAKRCGNAVPTRSHPTTPLKKTNSLTTFVGYNEGCKSAFLTQSQFRTYLTNRPIVYQNVSRTYRGPRASANRVIV